MLQRLAQPPLSEHRTLIINGIGIKTDDKPAQWLRRPLPKLRLCLADHILFTVAGTDTNKGIRARQVRVISATDRLTKRISRGTVAPVAALRAGVSTPKTHEPLRPKCPVVISLA
jgi:hypothetical protein